MIMAVEATHDLNSFTPQLVQHRDYSHQQRQQRQQQTSDDNNMNKKRSFDQFQQHRLWLGVDDIIFQHTKRMRLELQERHIQEVKQLVSAIGQGAMRKLKEKDEHIRRICELNSALEEKEKSLLVENQLWRELAHANQSAADSLRTQLQLQHEEEAESCCSNTNDYQMTMMRRCRMCREREPCVLVLPCRHLCLCSGCGSGSQIHDCPVCNAAVKATLHVNMSSTP